MISITLTQDQSRKVTVDHITDWMIIYKQYIDHKELVKYKFMLEEFAILAELDDIAKRFDRALPTNVTWDSI